MRRCGASWTGHHQRRIAERQGRAETAVRERLIAYAAAAFPGLGPPVEELVRPLTILPGEDEDRYELRVDGGIGVLMGHNLFKLAPLLGERIADALA